MNMGLSKRFARTELLLGSDALARLGRARVMVVGLGAVGSYALEALARAGVGQFTLVDFDRLSVTNVNRQLLALESTLGRAKTDVARERLLDINPGCQVERLPLLVNAETIGQIMAQPADLVVDAIDSLNPKVELLASMVTDRRRVISSMGAATRRDPWALRVGDLAETRVCPLAAALRQRLRRRGVRSGVRCIYSIEPVVAPPPEAEAAVVSLEEDNLGSGRPRRPLGSISYLTGMFGLLLAREALELLQAS